MTGPALPRRPAVLATSLSVVLAAAALVPLVGCRKGNGAGLHASGHVEATEIHLAAKVGGPLLDLPFEEGDRVEKDAVVARLDVTDARHDLARAKAELAAADARLRLLRAGSRAEELWKAREDVARAKVELDAAERDVVRLSGLAKRGTVTEKAADDAAARRDSLLRSWAGTRAVLARLEAGARGEEVDAAKAQKESVAALVATIEQRITDATVRAPRAGIVTARTAEPGEILPPGALISVLTDVANPWLTVYVDEPSLASIKIGDPVTVRVDGSTRDASGRVTFVSKVAEFTPKNVQTPEERAKLVFKLKVALDNRDGLFKPGMPADAWFGAAPAR